MALVKIWSLTRRPSSYQPSPRFSHYTVPIGGEVFMWSGLTEWGVQRQSVVEVFDGIVEEWHQKTTTGVPPPPMYYGGCAAVGTSMYISCGWDGASWYSSLHSLDSDSYVWNGVQPTNPGDGPMEKCSCGMISIDDDKLALIGGYGKPSHPLQPRATFVRDTRFRSGAGWTDEFHLFHTNQSMWSSPTITGDRPPPFSHSTFTAVDDYRAVSFAGLQPSGRMNDAFILDHRLMHWTKLQKTGGPWPKERSSHAACCIDYGGENPLLLVSGGIDEDGNTLKDAWLLSVNAARWKEVELPELQPRCSHSLTAISLAPGLTEVTAFGGCPKHDCTATYEQHPKVAETVLFRFESVEVSSTGDGPFPKEWILTGVTSKDQLGQPERLKEKLQKLREHGVFTGAQREGEMRATSEETHPLQQRITVLEGREREAERRREEAERRVAEAERQAAERVMELERGMQQLQTRLTQSEEAREDAEMGREEERRRKEVAEERVATVAEALRRQEEEEPSWVVRREEIQLTREELGRGGWAVVRVANFRGVRVAAKCLHQQIISDYNCGLFTREMNLAARIRHPNLLLFIGATIRGELIILTELMPTSLRAVLEQGSLTPPQRSSVTLGVAAALNYLHLMQPDPIIHRDISSANVLLEPSPNDSWRSKVSDYGSANFLQQLRTENPGAQPYASPEASIPTQQSTKMDIFSFGVLLVEVYTARFPVVGARERLILSIRDDRVVRLIRQCTAEDRTRRPTASEVITQIQQL